MKKDFKVVKWCRQTFWIILLIIADILNAFAWLGVAFIIMKMIDIDLSSSLDSLWPLMYGCGAITVLFIFSGTVKTFLQNKIVERVMVDTRQRIIAALMAKSLKDFRVCNTGKYVSMLNNDLKIIEEDYVKGFLLLIEKIILMVLGVSAIIYLSYQVLVTVIMCALLPIGFSMLFSKRNEKLQKEVSVNNAANTMITKDILSGFMVIKSFNIERFALDNIKKSNKKTEESKRRYGNVIGYTEIAATGATIVVCVVTFAVGAFYAYKGLLTMGSVMAIVELLDRIVYPVQIVATVRNKRKASKVLVSEIASVCDSSSERTTNGHTFDVIHDSIEMCNVAYSYNENDAAVLENINFKFKRGMSYAIVGASGSGKSTLVNLILGYYDNYTGKILIDGVDLHNIDSSSYYSAISVIQQDIFMFDDTLRNNITLYSDDDSDRLDQCIEMAELTGVVEKNGLDYKCGENGIQLSGGERQRVAICRALLKTPSVLVLDEATAALDNATAASIEQSILNISDITRIVVTHKLNKRLLKQYDCILMIKNGHIIEYGTFEELYNAKDNFYALYSINSNE